MQQYNVSLSEASDVADIPPTTVRSWRHRGHDLADPPLDLADVASLALMGRLVAFGMPLGAAADIARDLRDRWAEIMVTEADRPTLLARPEGAEFIFTTCPRVEVPDRLKDMTIVVDLVAILRHVLTELAIRQRRAE